MTDMKTTPAPISADLQAQAHDWLLRLQTGPVTAADAEAFRRWRAQDPRHALAFAQARRLWAALGPALQATAAPGEAPAANAGVPLSASAAALPVRQRPRRFNPGRRAFLGGAAAAAAVGWVAVQSPLGLWPALDALGADYRTATGERRDVGIGSVAVAMAARTTMRRPADGSAGIVVTEGEAQFALPASAATGFVIGVDGARLMPAPGAGECALRRRGHPHHLPGRAGRTGAWHAHRGAAALVAGTPDSGPDRLRGTGADRRHRRVATRLAGLRR